MKKKIFDIIQIGDKGNVPSLVFDYVLVANIIVNILVVVLETFEQLQGYLPVFRTLEIITTLFFCVEYVLRIWTADLLYKEKTPLKARLRFLVSYDGVVDLLTIISAFAIAGAVVFRTLRVVRIFHLFRLNARYDSFNIIASVIKERWRPISSSLFSIFVLML